MDFTIERSSTTNDYTLTDDQEEALAAMKQLNDIFILHGKAGVGKSVLINRFVEDMRYSGRNVILCAPTHKSLSIINGDFTIQSYLNLRLTWRKGERILVKGSRYSDKAEHGDVLIIDEISMLSNNKKSMIVDYILREQEQNDLKLILVGCIDQIPPVKEEVSSVWKIKAPSYTIEEIIRQKKGSGILSLAESVRTGLTHPGGDVSKFVNNSDVFLGNMIEMKKFFCENLNKGDDFMPSILSHKNSVADNANIWARRIVKNNPKEMFLPGESVFIRSSGNGQLHKLEDIVKILDISKAIRYNDLCEENDEEHMKVLHDFYVFKINVRSYKGEDELIIPASDNDKEIIEKNDKQLRKLAETKKIKWKVFHDFSDSLSEVKHIYAMTIHRSQGSTYKNVIVNYNDISDKNILYTAITRAAEKLFLLV